MIILFIVGTKNNIELLPVFNHSKFHFRYSWHEAEKQTEAEQIKTGSH